MVNRNKHNAKVGEMSLYSAIQGFRLSIVKRLKQILTFKKLSGLPGRQL